MVARRSILSLFCGGLWARIFAQCRQDTGAGILTDRLIGAKQEALRDATAQRRNYTASATVMLFAVPLVSRTGVGSGYALVEHAVTPGGAIVSIQFGAGSYPEAARGANRLGLIHEVMLEQPAGQPNESAYYALMTTSTETGLAQAKKVSDSTSGAATYVAAQGRGSCGVCAARVERMPLPAQYNWRKAGMLRQHLRTVLAGWPAPVEGPRGDATTFLYALRRAMLNPERRTTGDLFFNKKRFWLVTDKEHDAAMGKRFEDRKLVASADGVMRLNATIQDSITKVRTPFRIWYETGAEVPPLRFEYQPKSFLRLVFEADLTVQAPEVPLALVQ